MNIDIWRWVRACSMMGVRTKALILQLMIIENNHYSSNYYRVQMEKKVSKGLGLTVCRQRLRQRVTAPAPIREPSNTATNTPTLHNCIVSPPIPSYLVTPSSDGPSRVNWLKYNILVSIYHNWLRLEPFIRYWLQKTYEQSSIKQPHPLSEFLRRGSASKVPQGRKKVSKEEQGFDLLEQMRARREELLKGMIPGAADVEHLSRARHLAQQLLSTLPLENNKWSKIRIQRQNRLLDQMISSFNEEEFQMNSDVIMHSIKERLYFIDQMQKKYIDLSHDQKDNLQEKLELLKLPFKKVLNKASATKQPDELFQALWQEIQSERSKLLTKRPQLRCSNKISKAKHRYAILQKSPSNQLIFNYQYSQNNNDYALPTRKGKHTDCSTPTIDDSLQACKGAEATKDSQEAAVEANSQHESASGRCDTQEDALNAQLVEDFMRRQKQKANYRDQSSNFLKKPGGNKLDVTYRPSISFVDGKSIQDIGISEVRISTSNLRQRNSILRRRDSLMNRQVVSEEPQQREEHMSRFRSYKKLGTSKNIGASRHTKINRQLTRKDSQLVSLTRITNKLSRVQKRDFRRDPPELRKGAIHKKGKALSRSNTPQDQQRPSTPESMLALNRQEYIAYFNKILSGGHLDTSIHQSLRQQVRQLVRKNEPSAIIQNRAYVDKLVEKSAEDKNQSQLGKGRHELLRELAAVVRDDGRIKARLREEMKMYFSEESVQKRCPQDQTCNEQTIYNTTELRKINQELKRILCFKTQTDMLSFTKRAIRDYNNLQQCSI